MNKNFLRFCSGAFTKQILNGKLVFSRSEFHLLDICMSSFYQRQYFKVKSSQLQVIKLFLSTKYLNFEVFSREIG